MAHLEDRADANAPLPRRKIYILRMAGAVMCVLTSGDALSALPCNTLAPRRPGPKAPARSAAPAPARMRGACRRERGVAGSGVGGGGVGEQARPQGPENRKQSVGNLRARRLRGPKCGTAAAMAVEESERNKSLEKREKMRGAGID